MFSYVKKVFWIIFEEFLNCLIYIFLTFKYNDVLLTLNLVKPSVSLLLAVRKAKSYIKFQVKTGNAK